MIDRISIRSSLALKFVREPLLRNRWDKDCEFRALRFCIGIESEYPLIADKIDRSPRRVEVQVTKGPYTAYYPGLGLGTSLINRE